MKLVIRTRRIAIRLATFLLLTGAVSGGVLGGLGPLDELGGQARALLPKHASDYDTAGAQAQAQDPADCRRRKRPVRVRLDPKRWPHIADHLRDVHRSGRYPRVWRIDRAGADENRQQALDHWEKTKGQRYSEAERRGKDRDEAPSAVASTGGRWVGRGRFHYVHYASVRLVDSGENRSAGAYLGNALEDWCSKQKFVLVGR